MRLKSTPLDRVNSPLSNAGPENFLALLSVEKSPIKVLRFCLKRIASKSDYREKKDLGRCIILHLSLAHVTDLSFSVSKW